MTFRTYLIVAAALFPLAVSSLFGGCGSSVSYLDPSAASGGAGGHYVFVDATVPDAQPKPDAKPQPDALPDYTDPGCPNKPPAKEIFTCDPYKQDCKKGQACYIFTDYPEEPCGQEVYGANCYPAGVGQQGDACGGGQYCGAGYVCLITGSGTQCAKLCKLSGISGCTDGLVCEPIDVKGFGGCL